MSIFDNPLSQVIDPVNRFYNRRQDVIAGNIANVNTPGYRAFDLVLRSRIDAGPGLSPRTTHGRHLSGSSRTDEIGAETVRSRQPARVDGNNVSLEEELVKLMENRMRYEVGVDLLDRFGSLNGVARNRR